MVNALPAEGDGRVDIAGNIIDKYDFSWLDIRQMGTNLTEAGVVDRRIGLDQL